MLRLGKIAENVYDRSVVKIVRTLNNKSFGKIDSGSVINEGKICVSCSRSCSGIVKLDGRSAVIKAVNDIYSKRAQLLGVDISILLPVGSEEISLKRLITDISSFSTRNNIIIRNVDVSVISEVNDIVINASAYAEADKRQSRAFKAKASDDVILTKWIGILGTEILVSEYRDRLRKLYSSTFLSRTDDYSRYELISEELKVIGKREDVTLCNVSDGGIFAALWELSRRCGCGMDIDLRQIPVRQETIEICEALNVNPYELMSDGALLISCPNGKELTDCLNEAGIYASIIGKLTDNNDKRIINGDEIRFLEPSKTDSVYM